MKTSSCLEAPLNRHEHLEGGRGFARSYPLLGLAAGNNAACCSNRHANISRRRSRSTILPKQKISKMPSAKPRYSGEEGLLKLATLPEAHIVLIAIVGTTGLKPALAAIRAGKTLPWRRRKSS